MSGQIDLIAILTPKAGKAPRVRFQPLCHPTPHLHVPFQIVELLNEVSSYIQSNEPGTTRYQINVEVNKKSGVEEVILLES